MVFFVASGSAELMTLFFGGALGTGTARVLGLLMLEDVVHKMA
jgi:hypothetical protein